MATFDGPNLTIILASVGELDVQDDLYEQWKDWVVLSDNAKYPPAFDTLGGDVIGAGAQVAPYFFLRNDSGWRIKAPEQSGVVTVQGNLFGRDPDLPLFIPPDGAYTVVFNLVVTSRGTVTLVPVGSGLSSEQDVRLSRIEKILRNRVVTDPTTGVMTFYDDDNTPLMTAQIYEDAAGTQPYRGQGANRRERAT